jgi:hypothetical protein
VLAVGEGVPAIEPPPNEELVVHAQRERRPPARSPAEYKLDDRFHGGHNERINLVFLCLI